MVDMRAVLGRTSWAASQGGPLDAPIVVFRAGLVTVCALLSLVPVARPEAALVLVVLAVGNAVSYVIPQTAPAWAVVGALGAAAAVPFTGSDQSPLLPYLLTTGLCCGLRHGPRRLVTELGAVSGVLLLAPLLPVATAADRSYFVAAGEWVVLSAATGAVSLWARRQVGPLPGSDDYLQVQHLLRELRARARHLPESLDATGAAESLLRGCAELGPQRRSAVLVESAAGYFIPLAVRGDARVPWRGPLDDDGPLREAWLTGRPSVEHREADSGGRRRGSALAAFPLRTGDRPFGLMVVESADAEPMGSELVRALAHEAAVAAPRLETALLFEQVQEEASSAERERLAREMHDGIAQELASFGYDLDDLRLRAGHVDAALAERVAEVRGTVTRLISDLRLSITTLRTTLREDRGLGDALGSYLRAICSGRPVTLNLSLQETAFRLAPDLEVAVLRAAQAFAQQARRSVELTELTVRLVVDSPSASLRMSATGPVFSVELGEIGETLTQAGGRVAVSEMADAYPWLHVLLQGDLDDHLGAAGGRPRADQAGAAAGL